VQRYICQGSSATADNSLFRNSYKIAGFLLTLYMAIYRSLVLRKHYENMLCKDKQLLGA
jgi:hypothetical protein